MATLRHSLTAKLSLGILLLTMAIFVVSVWFLYHHSTRIIRNEVLERASSTIDNTTERIAHYLATVETATDNMEWLVTAHMQPDSLLAFTKRVVECSPDINGCSITTEPDFFPQYGRYFSAYSVRLADSIATVREDEYEYFEKVWYSTPRNLQRPCWVDPFDNTNGNAISASEMIVSYCKPIFLPDGQFAGVIATDLALSRMAKALQGEHPYPHSYFVMLGKDGRYFIHPDTAKVAKSTVFSSYDAAKYPDINALAQHMTAGQQGNMAVDLDGRTLLVCYRPLHGTPWSIALVSHESEVFRNYRHLNYIVMPLILVGLLIILLYCYRAVSRAAKPLKQLTEQTGMIAAGNYNVKMDTSKRTDDVGRLQNSFAAMHKSLVEHMEHIGQVNAIMAKRNEEQVKANELVEESVRQKANFMRDMTHQVRTPLNIILGFTTVLRDNGNQMTEEEREEIANMIDHNMVTITKMAHMLYDSSDAAKKGLERTDFVNCNDTARKCIINTERQFPGIKIAFSTTLPDQLCIHTSRVYLFRIIRELLYNAAKFSNGKSIALQLTLTRSTVRFVFQDQGPGIKAEDRERLFTPFTKTDDMSEGLGLGLPLTRRHVHALKGNFTIDTAYKQGCRIVVELPKD